jgi:Protein of unknown function (DUF3617)
MLLIHIAIAGALASSVAGVLAADNDAKLGLWEQTVTTQRDARSAASGSIGKGSGMSKGTAGLPPALRAELAQRDAAMRSGKPQTTLRRACVTAESLPKWENFGLGEDYESRCESKQTEQNAGQFKTAMVCNGGQESVSAEFNVQSPETIAGSITMIMHSDTGDQTTKTELSARWIGADCGIIAPGQSRRMPKRPGD